eukprot:9567263-Ditylum_brightwellii.AAC.1
MAELQLQLTVHKIRKQEQNSHVFSQFSISFVYYPDTLEIQSLSSNIYCNNMATVTCSNTSIIPSIASCITVEYNLTQEIMAFKEEGFNISTKHTKTTRPQLSSFLLMHN